MKKIDDLLPSKELINNYLNENSKYLRQYYGVSWQDRIRSWIFKRRYKAVVAFISHYKSVFNCVLDVGCGPMFIAYGIIRNFNANYVGIDIIPGPELKKYSKIIEKLTGKYIHVVRASAENLPFRKNIFNISLSLDVLEHLKNPHIALNDMDEVTNGYLIISLPLENTFQRTIRMPIIISEGIINDTTSEYHYVGPYKSYRDFWNKELREKIINVKYEPFGFVESVNFYAINVLYSK